MQRVKNFLYSSAELKKTVADTLSGDILTVANDVQSCLQKGGKLILMGNGGSAADSQHIAAELIGRFKKERRAMPAIALTVDTSSLTALGNDYGFDTIFERQIEALAQKNDAVIGISTSGNSENVVRALKKANAIGAKTIGLGVTMAVKLRRLPTYPSLFRRMIRREFRKSILPSGISFVNSLKKTYK